MEDCSDGIAAFCNQLRSYCLQLESSCAALRASVNQPPSSIPSPNVASLLTTLISHVSSASQAVAKLEAKTTETVSFEELIGHSMEIYKQNEASMDALEVHLRECGYTVPEFSPDDDLEELAKSIATCELSSETVPKLSYPINEGENPKLNESLNSLSVLSNFNAQFRSNTYQKVDEEDPYDDSFYSGAISLEELGLSSAALACLAEDDSSPGIVFGTDTKDFDTEAAAQGVNFTQEAAPSVEDVVLSKDVPFFEAVSEDEYLGCPAWLKVQISFEWRHAVYQSVYVCDVRVVELSGVESRMTHLENLFQQSFSYLREITDKMYEILANKQTLDQTYSTLSQTDITALDAGIKTKACLLLLVRVGRLRTEYANGETVYRIVHS